MRRKEKKYKENESRKKHKEREKDKMIKKRRIIDKRIKWIIKTKKKKGESKKE